MKIAEFANSVDPDEAAHNEPPRLNLYFLPYSLFMNSQYDTLWMKHFLNIADVVLSSAFWH